MIARFRRRLPRSAIAWFGAAAVAALGALLAVRAYVATLEATRPDVGPPTPVVVAATDLARGSVLVPDSFRLADVPSALVPPGALTGVEQVTGRVLAADLAEGETLTETRLGDAGSGPVAALVPPGLRAFVLPAGPPPGTIRAGDEVDVLATFGANAGRPYTETLAAALEVLDVVEGDRPLAVAGGPGAASAGPPIVVLADPITVERLARAASIGLLSIAIVGDDAAPATDTFAEADTLPTAAPSVGAPTP
ncbi:MAG TPA: Flp pilus assembly protein CpaB [Actinomycetota bacterium]|nr:Flp pilus assembly protein CpaB [Actinomycetota bacterium]